ncbi:MAG: type II secretion system minor pseudopilin GspK [Lautropia sp.]|nr:type II secretion system minor pseudopilin GspK [Lautropia sp.]
MRLPVSSPDRFALQRGAAIITALLVVALASVIVSALFYRESVAIRSIENRATLAQTRWIERAVIDWAKVILRNSQRDYDWPGSIWATPVAETQLDETVTGGAKVGDASRQALLAGRIRDAQARFNVNALVKDHSVGADASNTQSGSNNGLAGNNGNTGGSGTSADNADVSLAHLQAFRRLLGILSLPESLADRVLARVRKAALQKRQGRNSSDEGWVMPLQRFDDLRDLPGFSDEVMKKLQPHLTVLPADARTVNVNAGTAEVLEALSPMWNPAAIRSFVANRDVAPAHTLQDQVLGLVANRPLDGTLVAVRSDYFVADGMIRYDRVESQTETLLKRLDTGGVLVIWRHSN